MLHSVKKVHRIDDGASFTPEQVGFINSMTVDNSWIYTATTRAVEKLIIIGTEKAFREAIVRPSSAEKRQVYLSELIERLSEVEANID
ncbi:TPA: hypothetical protein ACN36H_003111 [Vibrio parahaemolyticus]